LSLRWCEGEHPWRRVRFPTLQQVDSRSVAKSVSVFNLKSEGYLLESLKKMKTTFFNLNNSDQKYLVSMTQVSSEIYYHE
jgi:hypothetical protein